MLVGGARRRVAPGTVEPPGFRLGACSTQRNLSDKGREQARRIGAWFRDRGLQPARVRSSPWCRCLDTARLAFGGTETWPALGSPHGSAEATNAQALAELHGALVAAARQSVRHEAWVTHAFVQSALAGTSTSSGEGLLLAPGPDGRAIVRGRIVVA